MEMKKPIDQLELFAEELPEQVEMAVAMGCFSTASSASTASCPATSASTFTTASTYG